MSVKEIPRSYLYTCDWCEASHGADNIYTQSTPPNWMTVNRFYAIPMSPAWLETELLCGACATELNKLMIDVKRRE